MMANARLRAQEIAVPEIAGRWQRLLADVVVPQYEALCTASMATEQEFLRRRLRAWRSYRLQELAQRIPNAGAKAAARRVLSPEP